MKNISSVYLAIEPGKKVLNSLNSFPKHVAIMLIRKYVPEECACRLYNVFLS